MRMESGRIGLRGWGGRGKEGERKPTQEEVLPLDLGVLLHQLEERRRGAARVQEVPEPLLHRLQFVGRG